MSGGKKGYPYYDMEQLTQNKEPVFLNISVDDEGEMEHNHGFYELMAILSGSGTHWINGTVYQVLPGDVFLLNFGDRHYLNPSDQKTEFRWIVLAWVPSWLTIDDPLLLNNKKYNDRATMHITNLLMDSLYEYNLKQQDYIDVIKYQLMAVLKKLKRLPEQREATYTDRHRKNLIKRATAYIHENYAQQITLKDIADLLDISQVYLCKLFSEEIGMGAIQYLRKVRVDRAALLLRTTEKKVSMIAAEVGFRDVKSFFSAFKTQMGVTPAAYRKHHHQSREEKHEEE
ncbi:MAG: helix-turn-helix domain-containing protein [Ruminococcaceae bacterium]|nr:helix-turn-helix domain-containing protein [Oscillospiraceae bacterium]